MTFLEQYRASRLAGLPDSDRVEEAIVREWLTSRPAALMDDLGEHEPTFVTGRMAFVTRYDDVRDVLARNDVFSVRPYGQAMMRINRGPNFLLGMDDGPEYQQQLSLLRRAFRPDDVDRVRAIVSARTSELLAPALVEGRLDLTDGFARLIPALFVADYFGVAGPDPATLMKWARIIFTDGFANAAQNPFVSRRAMRASEEFRAYLDELIRRTRANPAQGTAARDDILGRLIALEQAGEPAFSDATIRDNLLWCIAGMIDNVNTAVCSAIDCMLGNPEVMQGAVDAAVARDPDRLRKYVFEALRFRTPTPVVTRQSVREHTLSKGTPHEKTIPPDTLVFAGMGTAMMDGTVVESPKAFRLGRPPEHYLHFGTGLHHCLGRHIAEVHVAEIVGSVLRLDGIRRARGMAGRLRYAGPFPKKFTVEFERPGIAA
jgi:cytochrome P450